METLSLADPFALLVVGLSLALGGILKGATGAGAPILAVPVMTAVFDVRVAVAVMVIPNLITNITQVVKFRAHAPPNTMARDFALSAVAGAAVGTLFLAWLPTSLLQLSMAVLILAYIALKLAWPGMVLPMPAAQRIALPAGLGGGILQGALGISAPIALTFLNAVALPRPAFIFTVSMFFAAMGAVQLPLLTSLGLFTPTIAVLGLMALVPMMGALPLGDWIGRRVSGAVFDRVILGFLLLLALRLIWVELA